MGEKVRLEFQRTYVASGTIYKFGRGSTVFGIPLGVKDVAIMVDYVRDGTVKLKVPPNKVGLLSESIDGCVVWDMDCIVKDDDATGSRILEGEDFWEEFGAG